MTKTVLFVDDEQPMLRALSREFGVEFDMTVAYSAAEALELMAGPRSFDVVVSDVTMPGMNGLDFIEQAAMRHPYTRYIVLTGDGDPATQQRADTMPEVSQLLTKPCDRETIMQAIENAVAASTAS